VERINDIPACLKLLEDERESIGHQLHAGLAQHITNAVMRGEIVKKLFLLGRTDDAMEQMDKVLAFLQQAVTDVQQCLFELRPADDAVPFADAVARHLDRLGMKANTQIQIYGTDDWPHASPLCRYFALKLVASVTAFAAQPGLVDAIEIRACMGDAAHDGQDILRDEVVDKRSGNLGTLQIGIVGPGASRYLQVDSFAHLQNIVDQFGGRIAYEVNEQLGGESTHLSSLILRMHVT